MSRPFILKEASYSEILKHKYEVAILPWGATEAHNFHLPYGTDIYQCEHIAAKSAEEAWQKGCRLMVLPALPFGVNCQQIDIPFTINMNPSTQMALLKDICHSLDYHKIYKLVILNGHGGNDFRQIIRELKMNFPNIFICSVDWFKIVQTLEKIFENPGDHADEMETSLMMYIEPKIVMPLQIAGDGYARKLIFDARSEGWMWAPREWTKVTNDTGVGDPAKSSVEKGEQCFQQVVYKFTQFLQQLYNTDLNKLYK
ncbi:MAG: creatininase family protein [Cyclobacteriaceae bacterium]|nr:creatininase family protein [Cyclobacteriaceae bacterium]